LSCWHAEEWWVPTAMLVVWIDHPMNMMTKRSLLEDWCSQVVRTVGSVCAKSEKNQ